MAVVVLMLASFVLLYRIADLNSPPAGPVVFERDRAQLEEVVRWVYDHADCDEYYVELPRHLSHLSYHGLVSCWSEEVFIPQWAGIPDDAGGFWYSPNRSPAGNDMWGMICENPVNLGDGWWTCGMGS